MFDDPISSNELIEAARDYARAVALAENTAAAAREADIPLTKADIATLLDNAPEAYSGYGGDGMRRLETI